MRSIKKITSEMIQTNDIKGLVGVYEEISATKMQEIRGEVLKSRDFFDRLALLSTEIGTDLEKNSLTKTKKDVAIFISGSGGLYGDLIDKVFVEFTKFVRSNPDVDIVVIGKDGNQMIKDLTNIKNYKFYDLVDESISGESLTEVLGEIVKYRKIYLFYGKFKNIVTQETWTETISGQVLGDIQDRIESEQFLYIYEPNPTEVARMFSDEISGIIFDRTIKESKLAKHASRLLYLDSVLENVDYRTKKLNLEKNKAVKRLNERKQLTGIAGLVHYK